MRTLPLLAALLTTLPLATPALAGSSGFMGRVERDQTVDVPSQDPAMRAAMREARRTLDRFLALARNPRPGTSDFAVKIGIREGDRHEFFWITGFREGNPFSGTLGNTPRLVTGVSAGQTIRFAKADIVDWNYRDNGRMRGNYTACALLTREPPQAAAEMRARFGLVCPP